MSWNGIWRSMACGWASDVWESLDSACAWLVTFEMPLSFNFYPTLSEPPVCGQHGFSFSFHPSYQFFHKCFFTVVCCWPWRHRCLVALCCTWLRYVSRECVCVHASITIIVWISASTSSTTSTYDTFTLTIVTAAIGSKSWEVEVHDPYPSPPKKSNNIWAWSWV